MGSLLLDMMAIAFAAKRGADGTETGGDSEARRYPPDP
jgi:hypothetical protein